MYEQHDEIEKKISSYKYDDDKPIKLEEFLQNVTFTVDNYETNCKEYVDNTLYLSILATKTENEIITYKIPLKFNESCSIN